MDHEAEIIAAAAKLAELDLTDDPDAAAAAAEAIELAQASLEAMWALRPIIDEARRARKGR